MRRAAPVVGSCQVGDNVSYCREPRTGEHGLQWSVGSRLIGFEKDRNSLGETQPRTSRIIRDSMSMHVSGIVGFFTSHKPKDLHFLRRMLRNNKASSTNVLHSILRLPIRHRLPMKPRTKTSGTTKYQSQHEQRKQTSEKRFRRTQQQSYGHRYP